MTDYRDRKYDRDKRPSWREIDRRKDRSKHIRDDREERRPKPEGVKTGYSRYKEQLEELFKSGVKSDVIKNIIERAGEKYGMKNVAEEFKGNVPERQKLLRALREAVGEKEVKKIVDEFFAKFTELPDDIEILTQALLHPDDDIKVRVLVKISKYLNAHMLEDKALLFERASNLAEFSEDDRVFELARQVVKKLGG